MWFHLGGASLLLTAGLIVTCLITGRKLYPSEPLMAIAVSMLWAAGSTVVVAFLLKLVLHR
ncbi:hypothetical protein ACGE24_07105 [Corynebacterium kroppenstedtii]|uniref:hypothetical protein n=1 Tax=Corynebacterium sp. PCR 32 TaxID=3351342 RepID=UPI00309B7428